MTYVHLACRLLVACVFLASVLGKVRSATAFRAFTGAIRQTRLVPAALVRPAAIGVVASEAVVVAALALSVARPGFTSLVGFGVAAGLLVAFSAVILAVARRGDRVVCACFGSSTAPMGVAHLWRNGALLAVVLIGAATSSATGAYRPGPVAVSAFAGLAGALVTVLFVDLVSPFTDLRPADRRSVGRGSVHPPRPQARTGQGGNRG